MPCGGMILGRAPWSAEFACPGFPAGGPGHATGGPALGASPNRFWSASGTGCSGVGVNCLTAEKSMLFTSLIACSIVVSVTPGPVEPAIELEAPAEDEAGSGG